MTFSLIRVATCAIVLTICCQIVLSTYIGTNHDTSKRLSRVALGSCNDQRRDMSIWSEISTYDPDLWVWLGDNVYHDVAKGGVFHDSSVEQMKENYKILREYKDYKTFAASHDIIGMWDDHDYGINNGDASYPNKEVAKEMMLDFLDEPVDSPRRAQPGTYASYVVGEGKEKVHFILTDNRFFAEKEVSMLGEEQWKWLESEVRSSDAAFIFIASGVQVLPNYRPFAEKWANTPNERKRLLHLIRTTKKPVILLSGDIHTAELLQLNMCDIHGDNIEERMKEGLTPARLPEAGDVRERTLLYTPVFELTTSGMTHACGLSKYRLDCQGFAPSFFGNTYRMDESLFPYLNFATLEFDWDDKTWGPSVDLQIRDKNGNVVRSQRVFSNLESQPRSPNKCLVTFNDVPLNSFWNTYELGGDLKTTIYMVIIAFFCLVALMLRCLWRCCCAISRSEKKSSDSESAKKKKNN